MMHMGAFDRARVHFLGALARHASLEPVLRQVLAGLKARAESTDAPSDWFQVAFLHDVLGERGPAEELYRKVATTGIGEPMRSFVATALSRIESPAARE